jgi:metal-sulfur cluster biosynthetic enzyme
VTEEEVWKALKQVKDPEFAASVVELGFIYRVAVSDTRIEVDYTLTAMGCPLAGMIDADIKRVLRGALRAALRKGEGETSGDASADPAGEGLAGGGKARAFLKKALGLGPIGGVTVVPRLVWEPPWGPERMSDGLKLRWGYPI